MSIVCVCQFDWLNLLQSLMRHISHVWWSWNIIYIFFSYICNSRCLSAVMFYMSNGVIAYSIKNTWHLEMLFGRCVGFGRHNTGYSWRQFVSRRYPGRYPAQHSTDQVILCMMYWSLTFIRPYNCICFLYITQITLFHLLWMTVNLVSFLWTYALET